MNDCIFCKIVAGDIGSHCIYQDDKTYAFLDISCDYPGHTLVVSKQHCTNILDADSDTLNAVINTVQKISRHYVDNVGYDGVNIIANNNSCAEQSVFHLHVHIIPRTNGDSYHVFPVNDKQPLDLLSMCQTHRLP